MALNKAHTHDEAAPAPAPAPGAKKVPAAVEAAPAADMELGAMAKFRAKSVRIRDPHSKVMFYTDRDCPAEVTPWLRAQLKAGIIFTC